MFNFSNNIKLHVIRDIVKYTFLITICIISNKCHYTKQINFKKMQIDLCYFLNHHEFARFIDISMYFTINLNDFTRKFNVTQKFIYVVQL